MISPTMLVATYAIYMYHHKVSFIHKVPSILVGSRRGVVAVAVVGRAKGQFAKLLYLKNERFFFTGGWDTWSGYATDSPVLVTSQYYQNFYNGF